MSPFPYNPLRLCVASMPQEAGLLRLNKKEIT